MKLYVFDYGYLEGFFGLSYRVVTTSPKTALDCVKNFICSNKKENKIYRAEWRRATLKKLPMDFHLYKIGLPKGFETNIESNAVYTGNKDKGTLKIFKKRTMK